VAKIDLERIISQWPEVSHYKTVTQVVYLVTGVKFCWLSPNGMVQIRPPLGRGCDTRYLKRNGNKVKVIHRRSGRVDAIYNDPGNHLVPRFSYPGFMCSKTSEDNAVNLVRQSYNNARSATKTRSSHANLFTI